MILLINPKSAIHNRRVPLSLLTVGTGLEGKFTYDIIDKNYIPSIETTLDQMLKAKDISYVGITVMPGPQLTRAIAISKFIRKHFPKIFILWGGTFPSIHTDTVLSSGVVDAVILGQGEIILPEVVHCMENNLSLESVKGIAYRSGDEILRTSLREMVHPDSLPQLPYHKIDVYRYLQRTYLGNRTSVYHSSLGCPFTCGFCSVVAIFNGKWIARSAEHIAQDILFLKNSYGVDSIEFYDDNFFTSEKRVAEFSERIRPHSIAWWGEGRSDTLYHYSDATLRKMRDAGCRMIFTGAETSSQEQLQLMGKGGTQNAELILEFARRIKEYDIVPEFSFIFGSPSEDIDGDIEKDIQFIKKIKQVNPLSEIIFYVYAPVLLPGSAMFEEAKKHGFDYPKILDDWMKPQWQHFDLRKRPMTPWMKPRHIEKIRNFERVLNGRFPSITDLRLTEPRRKFLRLLSGWRYNKDFYWAPYEVRFVLSKVFKYRQPELEGAAQYPPTTL